jgi:UDP-glucuronate decarboxylase
MLELAATVIELVGSRSRVVHKAVPENDPRQRRPDISKAIKLLGWTPRTPLREGLKATISYFEELLKESSVRNMLNAIEGTQDVSSASGTGKYR